MNYGDERMGVDFFGDVVGKFFSVYCQSAASGNIGVCRCFHRDGA